MADKMMRIAGRGDDGTAKAIGTDNNGSIKVKLASSDVAVPVDIQYHDLATPIPVAPSLQPYLASGAIDPMFVLQTITATKETMANVPSGARGLIAGLIVSAVSGTFSDGQGIALRVRVGLPGKSGTVTITKIFDTDTGTKFTPLTAPGNNALFLHPDFSSSIGDATPGKILHVKGWLPKDSEVGFSAVVSGTDPSAEIELVVQWLF